MHISFVLTALLTFLFTFNLNAEGIRGLITDRETNEPLIGVNIIAENHGGIATGIDGNYSLLLPAGQHQLIISYLGYREIKTEVTIEPGIWLERNFQMQAASRELDIVVVSGGKFERKITEETVSIDVLSADLIQRTNTVRLNDAIDKVPGVSILDGQVAIRGGSGYAYGAGSRVLVVVDDMPMITADRSDIRWSNIPMEIAEQVEVMKGAASALYGASALNGVINVQTAWPSSEPATRINTYYNITGNPKREETIWWDYPPFETGITFAHLERFGRFDLVMSGLGLKKIGHLRLANDNIYRFNFKTRYRPKKIEGLSFGVNGNVMYADEGEFFYWADAGEGSYIPNGSTGPGHRGTLYRGRRTNISIDPHVTYFDKANNRHALRMRHFTLLQHYANGGSANGTMLTAEYQFQKEFANAWRWTVGASNNYFFTVNKDLGDNTGNLASAFTQLDMKIGKLTASAGFRWEIFNLNDSIGTSMPVGRLGLNYPVTQSTFLRTSIGQGYRFPSIAERFVDTDVGDDIKIFPNPDLKPEYGYSAEFGIKQAVRIREWLSYFDLAFFWTDYWQMTEFQIGLYPPPGQPPTIDYLGFRSENVSRARIAGFELGIMGEGNILHNLPMRFYGGYTYTYPADLSTDSLLAKPGVYMERLWSSFLSREDLNMDGLLKYRFRHMFKADLDVDFRKFTFGFDARYYSFMEGVDQVFLIFIPDIKEYREQNETGNWILGIRAGYEVNEFLNLRVLVNNITNNEYFIRPAKLEQPRNYTLQLAFNF